jgi:actinin alpha
MRKKQTSNYFIGRLDPKEFRACLIACGYNIREDRQGDVDFQRIMANVDPTQTGFVTFESFLDFMTRECSEEDSVDHLTLAFKTLSADKVNRIINILYKLIIFYF